MLCCVVLRAGEEVELFIKCCNIWACGIMWGALQDAARAITLFLDRSSEGHRKCPRCKGSGLLGNAFTRMEKKGAHLDQPCWFCEGIGALPIVGLNGFVLARATPCLRTLDNHNQPHKDNLQLYHGRFCKKTGEFTYAKLGANLADLLFDLNTSPWVNCTSMGGHQQNLIGSSEANESIQSCVSEPRLQPLSGFFQNNPCWRNGYSLRILMSTPRVFSIANISQPKKARPSTSSAILVSVHQKTANSRSVLKLKGAFAMQHVPHTWKISCCNVSSMTQRLHLEPELSRHFSAGLECETAAYVGSFKRRRLRRKARNCVKDKAGKEAQERMQGLIRTLNYKGELDLTDSHVQPEPLDTTSRCLQEWKVHGERSLPSDMPSRVVWSVSVAVVVRQFLLNQLVADGCKMLIPATAKSTI